MNKSLILVTIISTLLLSCSTEKLNKYVEICGCEVTEHFIASTDNEENSTKEYTFSGSPLFKYGIPKYDFALNMAIIINQELIIDSLTILRITVEKENSKIKSYEFDYYELNRMTPKHTRIHKIISSFVENIYKGEYQKCREYIGFDIDDSKYNSIMTSIHNDFENGYIDTKIVSFKKAKAKVYNIHGAVWTKDETLDLFSMQLIEREEGFKIIEFAF